MWKHVVSVAVGLGFVCPLLSEVFPEGTTTINDERSYTSGEELALTNEAGSTVKVVSGGSIIYDAASVSAATTPVLTIGAGSELKLEGTGNATFNDFAGLVSVQGAAGNPAKITIGDTGSLKFVATRSSGMALLGAIHLGPYSELDVSGNGVFETSDSVAGYNTPRNPMFFLEGGRIRVRDNAIYKMGDVSDSSSQFRIGTVEFSDSAALDFRSGTRSAYGSLMIGCKGAAGEKIEVVFKDHARTETAGAYNVPGAIRLTNPNKGTWTILRHHSDQALSLGAICYVGIASTGNSWKGGALYEQTNGFARVGGNGGLHVAHVADGLTQVCTGLVSLADCGFHVRANLGGNSSGSGYHNQFTGLIVGRGPAIVDNKTYAFAEMRISGTAGVTNEFGYVAIGTGRSTARVIQTGGTFYSYPPCPAGRPVTVGLAGGTGEWLLSNGVVMVRSDVYVGGAPVATSHAGVNWRGTTSDGSAYGEDYSIGGAVGTFVISAADRAKTCKLQLERLNDSVPGFIHVGENGTGVFEVGEGGHVNCRGLILSGPTATLKFTLGETGKCLDGEPAFMRIKAQAGSTGDDGGLLTVGAGAKLVVDARNYKSSDKWVLLVLPNRREGSFAAEDITVLGPGEVVQDRPGYRDPNGRTGLLWYRRRDGLMLIVR